MSVDKGDGEAIRRFVQSMDIPYPVVIAPEVVAWQELPGDGNPRHFSHR